MSFLVMQDGQREEKISGFEQFVSQTDFDGRDQRGILGELFDGGVVIWRDEVVGEEVMGFLDKDE